MGEYLFRCRIDYPCKCSAIVVYDNLFNYENEYRIEKYNFCINHYNEMKQRNLEMKELYKKATSTINIDIEPVKYGSDIAKD